MTPFLLLSIVQKAIYPHCSFQSPTPFLSLRSFFLGICHQSVTFRFWNFSVSRLLSIFGGLRFRFRRIWSWKKTRFQKTTLGIGFGQIFGLVIQCIPLDHIRLADFPTVYFLQFCHGRQQAVVTPWGWTIFELLFLWDQTTSNLLAYNLQIPYKYYHWDCSSRWDIWQLGQDSQEWHAWHFNLTSQDTCEGQLSQFLRWLFIGL